MPEEPAGRHPDHGAAWGSAAPIFRVADLGASIDYYVRVLGFGLDWSENLVASVSRDRCTIFLGAGDQTEGRTWAWIGVRDVEALHEELRRRGAVIRQPPTNFDWALEMQVADPDANVLRLGSEPRPNAPQGPWLDASGRLWSLHPDGTWLESGPQGNG